MIKIESVTKKFGGFTAVNGVSMEIGQGKFFVLLGPSGCGKTTLLRMLAGFEEPTVGRIVLDGKDLAGYPPNLRPTNMVFQSYALFPHLSVFKNIAYGPTIKGEDKKVIRSKVGEVLEITGMERFRNRKPGDLSGGQRQRVALARALIMQPKVLLLDEPLSALDAKLREMMRNELVKLQRKVGITFVMVTHDQEEALSMADSVAVMRNGGLEQCGSPQEVYKRPANSFVANFIGRINWLSTLRAEVRNKTLSAELEGIGEVGFRLEDAPDSEGQKLVLGIRPEYLKILDCEASEETEKEGIELRAWVKEQVFLGASQQIRVAYGPQQTRELSANVPNHAHFEAGKEIRLLLPFENILLTKAVQFPEN